MSNITICGQQLNSEAPSKATLRIASFKAVSGKKFMMGCKKAGKVVFEKKVQDKKY
jgi:hypothetical protein